MMFLTMDEGQAAALRDATAGEGERLEPRLVTAGPQAGRWALPARVRDDPAFAGETLLATLPLAALTVAEAWPPENEPAL